MLHDDISLYLIMSSSKTFDLKIHMDPCMDLNLAKFSQMETITYYYRLMWHDTKIHPPMLDID
jgi:hypothetical protein